VGEDDAAAAGEDEVAAKLQQVLARVGPLHPVAAEHPAEVAQQDAGPEEREPRGPFEAERAVRGPVRVSRERHAPAGPGRVPRERLGLRLRHDEYGAARGREPVAGGVHLAEVGVARDSGEVAEEDEEEELAVEERREPDGRPVRPEEREVGRRVAGLHFFTFSSTMSDAALPALNSAGRGDSSGPKQTVSLSFSSL